jgi:hypothetical protein
MEQGKWTEKFKTHSLVQDHSQKLDREEIALDFSSNHYQCFLIGCQSEVVINNPFSR